MAVVSMARAQKMVAECARFRSPSDPVAIACDLAGWWAIYDAEARWAEAKWVFVAPPDVSAETLKGRIAAVMSSEHLGFDLPEWDVETDGVGGAGLLSSGGTADDDDLGAVPIGLVLVAEDVTGNVKLLFPRMVADDDGGGGLEVFVDGVHEFCPEPNLGNRLREIIDAVGSEWPKPLRQASKWIRSKVARQDLQFVSYVVEDNYEDFFEALPLSFDGIDPVDAVRQVHHVLFVRPPGHGWHCKATHWFGPEDEHDEQWCEMPTILNRPWRPIVEPGDSIDFKESLESELATLLSEAQLARISPLNEDLEEPDGPSCSCVRPEADLVAQLAAEPEVAVSARYVLRCIERVRDALTDGALMCAPVSGDPDGREPVTAAAVLAEAAEQVDDTVLFSVQGILMKVVALLPPPEQECIGYGCDPDEMLIGAARRWLAEAERIAALWLAAATAHECVQRAEGLKKKQPLLIHDADCEQITADLSLASKFSQGDHTTEAGRAVSLLLRPLSKASADKGMRHIQDTARLRSLAAKASKKACEALIDAAMDDMFGVCADLARRPEWHSNTGDMWNINEGRDSPAMLLWLDSPQCGPMMMIRPPLRSLPASRWERDESAAHWRDTAASRGIEFRAAPLGNAYETCNECGCPLHAETEPVSVKCPNCGVQAEPMRLDDTTKAAQTLVAVFPTDRAAVEAATKLDSDFISWRDQLLTETPQL